MNFETLSLPHDDPALRAALKGCSPATYYAACKFQHSGRREDLHTVLLGVLERFVDRDLRPRLNRNEGSLRLNEDLGFDSLTMMEIVMIAEEAWGISVANQELTHLRTVGQLQNFLESKLAQPRSGPEKSAAASPIGNIAANDANRPADRIAAHSASFALRPD